MTPIDILHSMIDRQPYQADTGESDLAYVQEVLAPEQCMVVWFNGRAYHVTIEPITE
jgi:hypothetical protein